MGFLNKLLGRNQTRPQGGVGAQVQPHHQTPQSPYHRGGTGVANGRTFTQQQGQAKPSPMTVNTSKNEVNSAKCTLREKLLMVARGEGDVVISIDRNDENKPTELYYKVDTKALSVVEAYFSEEGLVIDGVWHQSDHENARRMEITKIIQ